MASRVWAQLAALLLGVTLTVGFYEGRRLVGNAQRALSAASALTSATPVEAEPSVAAAPPPVPRRRPADPGTRSKSTSTSKSKSKSKSKSRNKARPGKAKRPRRVRGQKVERLRQALDAEGLLLPDGSVDLDELDRRGLLDEDGRPVEGLIEVLLSETGTPGGGAPDVE